MDHSIRRWTDVVVFQSLRHRELPDTDAGMVALDLAKPFEKVIQDFEPGGVVHKLVTDVVREPIMVEDGADLEVVLVQLHSL